MPVEYRDWITREDLRAEPDKLFLFGDNVQRVGMGGQAGEMRGEPNAVGVATKWSPSEYFTDDRLEEQALIIAMDISIAHCHVREGKTVVIPRRGLGTGLAQLPRRAPKTFKCLRAHLAELAGEDSALMKPK